MKMYIVEYETKPSLSGPDYKYYRYVSLYNGARGVWRFSKSDAENDGERHQKIVERLHLEIEP